MVCDLRRERFLEQFSVRRNGDNEGYNFRTIINQNLWQNSKLNSLKQFRGVHSCGCHHEIVAQSPPRCRSAHAPVPTDRWWSAVWWWLGTHQHNNNNYTTYTGCFFLWIQSGDCKSAILRSFKQFLYFLHSKIWAHFHFGTFDQNICISIVQGMDQKYQNESALLFCYAKSTKTA